MGYEDFTTYTEVDTFNRLTVTTNRATGVDVDLDIDVYLYKDKGVNHFDALDEEFEIYISSNSSGDACYAGMAITNTIGTRADLAATDVCVQSNYRDAAAERIRFLRGNFVVNDDYTALENTLYYCRIERTAGNDTVNLKIYSNSSRTTLLDTLVVTGFGTTKYRYVYGFINSNSATSDNDWDGYVQNLDLREPVVITPPTLTLTLTPYVPTIITTSNILVTPGTLALNLTFYAPTVFLPLNIIARIAFATDPYSDSPSWTDVSSDLIAFTTKRGRQHQLDRFQAGTATLLLRNTGGHYWPHNTGGDHYPNVKLGKRVNIRVIREGTTYDLYTGFIRKMNPIWFSDVGQLQPGMEIECVDLQRNLARGKKDVDYSQEASGTRVGNVLTSAGWNATERDIDTGDETVQATGAVTINLQEHLYKVQESELSTLFIKGNGYVKYEDRGAWEGNSSQATFGTGEIPIYDPVFPLEDDLLYNEIRLTRTSGSEQSASDAGSITDHGIRSLVRTGLLNISDAPVLILAYYLLARHYDIKMRIKEFTVLPQTDESTLWPYVLGWDIGTKVTLVWTEADINGDYFIEGIAHSWDYREGLWRTKYQCSDAARYFYTPDAVEDALRPDGAGDKTEVQNQFPASTSHYDKVDEESADEDTTYIYTTANSGGYRRDLYHIEAAPYPQGTINKVTVYARIKRDSGSPAEALSRVICKTGGTEYASAQFQCTTSYANYNKEWANNPGGGAWSWADIDALQIGIELASDSPSPGRIWRCTQVWAVINYTPIW